MDDQVGEGTFGRYTLGYLCHFSQNNIWSSHQENCPLFPKLDQSLRTNARVFKLNNLLIRHKKIVMEIMKVHVMTSLSTEIFCQQINATVGGN